MTLNGFDIYSGTPEADVVKALASDFVIVKASEGATYVNPKHDEHVQRTRTAGKLVGHYHYARPESNGPDTEARSFLRAAKALPGDVVVLDFEPPQILPVYPAWVLGFADVVTSTTGAPCWLYTNQSQGRALMSLSTPEQRVQLALMPLWKAYYQTAVGDLMGWPTWACWQRTSTPMDADVFNGDAALWRSLGVPGDDMALSPDERKILDELLNIARTARRDGSTAAWPYQFTPVDEILSRLATLLSRPAPTPPVPLSDEDVQRIAVAVADENARRQQS